MKILVTGANGFVGKHLVQGLSNHHEVVAVVRRDGGSGASNLCVIPEISSSTDWTGLMEDVDIVIHLAARVHVMEEKAENPLSEFRAINVEGTRVLATEAVKQGVKRFIFLSSVKVHGEGSRHRPYSATDTPSPVDPYGTSKWEAEQILKEISSSSGLQVVVLRSPVIYGPGVKGNINRIARLVATKIPLPLGAVNNRRSMISISNLMKWIDRAMTDHRVPQGPVLVSDPEPVSTKSLVTSIAMGMGINSRMVPVPVRLMKSAAALLGKRSLAQRLFDDLEVIPSFDLYEGIKEELIEAEVELRNFGRTFN